MRQKRWRRQIGAAGGGSGEKVCGPGMGALGGASGGCGGYDILGLPQTMVGPFLAGALH
ncbi:MAG: hypothetical protein HYS13_09690 [Planctomycetia bacterium]|nr:hypothetical protein [Planctomycetia bacterium]